MRRRSRGRWGGGLLRAGPAILIAMVVALPAQAVPDSAYFDTSDGVRLHYAHAGQGATLVFIPGWTFSGRIWAAQLKHFAGKYRAVAFDPRSQGRSAIAGKGHTPQRRAQDIAELIDVLGAEPVVLVGWSLGVLEALSYVKLKGSARLAGLVLVDNSVGEQPPPQPTGFLAHYRRNRRAAMEEYVRGMFKTPRSEAYLRQLVAESLRTPFAASIELLTSLYPRDVWRRLVRSVQTPLLYVVTPEFAEQAQNLRRKRPEVWSEVFQEAGHALFVDEPARFNRLLERFLTTAVWPRG